MEYNPHIAAAKHPEKAAKHHRPVHQHHQAGMYAKAAYEAWPAHVHQALTKA